MAQIQLSGLASGLDTSAIVQRLLALERRPITLLEKRRTGLQTLSTALQTLGDKLAALKAQAEAMRDPEKVFARAATSSAEGVLGVLASGAAARGSYTITVTSTARGSIAAAAATVASVDAVVAGEGGTFQFKLGTTGEVVSVPLAPGATLAQLAQGINTASAGVHAAVVNVGTAAEPAWRLTLISAGTGTAHDIIVVDDPTVLGVTTTRPATDAVFSIEGVGTFTRATNSVTDVLAGVTLTLRGPGTSDVTIDDDAGGTRQRVQGLLDAYNAVIRTLDEHSRGATGADGKTTPGPFSGDALVRQLRRALGQSTATNVGGPVATLADLGVTTAMDGTLSLDAARFDQALAADPDGVRRVVAGSATVSGVADVLYARAEAATRAATGTLAIRQEGLRTTMRALQDQIDTGLARLEITERTLQARFVALEQAMARLQATGSSLLMQLDRLTLRDR